MTSLNTPDAVRARAAELDAADELAHLRERFVPMDACGTVGGAVLSYLDGNSLGRPLKSAAEALDRIVSEAWGTRLIRSWDEQWMELPLRLGDRLGEVALGAAPGQVVVADSTTVMLYKLLRAGLAAAQAADPARREIVVDTGNFPTDRYVAEGIAAECDAELVWIEADAGTGVTTEQVRDAVGSATAAVVLSHVAYRSAYVADLPAITQVVHEAGGLVLWDLCHSAGVVPVDLDEHEVDLAVGCSYKYLNGGPGAPAFGYVAARHQERMTQPIQGWMGHAEPFVMGPGYQPSPGMRRFISGTPPVLGMVPLGEMVELVADVGLPALTAKATALTEFAIEVTDGLLTRHGVSVDSPRDPAQRGGHVTLGHPAAREVIAALWEQGVIPDFREPDGVRLGMSPASTSFAEVAEGLLLLDAELERAGRG
ncbi:aminotransferase class V-fold PLP-dependent enzyme [Kytococcus sedentarius]|uniref:Kynureninase n=1 Tax=Kytococcus sedentarius (strain ATCC 14392 / DSM 20547 / JCM 11482 / CCUG 33030 / NBRC 15357 / NCTC 11040 / CCM 314 / 541) TaxID=478801 RepID=C7NJH3_KYTSD|nr:aminotransferase class V-fold PLP-dependent enzyme [Kytococcus sedentarius]ACV05303.1 Kynureninase [Kytococcus sedentarius DSM 20547]QQB63756.1 aminotransferase class V-fold PLP-dependent enzyme [Kytococcus sedentarius]STX13287.1 Kynureninase [Kytococcus sedentarius]